MEVFAVEDGMDPVRECVVRRALMLCSQDAGVFELVLVEFTGHGAEVSCISRWFSSGKGGACLPSPARQCATCMAGDRLDGYVCTGKH